MRSANCLCSPGLERKRLYIGGEGEIGNCECLPITGFQVCTPSRQHRWMTQIARNLTDPNDGFLRGKRYLILDPDTKYSDAFRSVLVREGIQVVRLPARSPNLNAFAERFVRSIKEECLSRMIFFAPASLQHALRQFMAHYPTERNHQGLENRIQQPMSVAALPHHPVQRRQRLGGMLSYYHRVAA